MSNIQLANSHVFLCSFYNWNSTTPCFSIIASKHLVEMKYCQFLNLLSFYNETHISKLPSFVLLNWKIFCSQNNELLSKFDDCCYPDWIIYMSRLGYGNTIESFLWMNIAIKASLICYVKWIKDKYLHTLPISQDLKIF